MQIGSDPAKQYFMPIAWYFAPKGAKTFRGISAFSAQIWDRNKPFDEFHVGEQNPNGEIWYNGRNVWGYLGQCYVGTLHDYQFGLSAAQIANPPGYLPGCCLKMRAPLGVRFGIGPRADVPEANLGVRFGLCAAVPVASELGVAFGLDASPAFAGELGVAFGVYARGPTSAELGVAFGLDVIKPSAAELGVAFGVYAQTPIAAELGVAFGVYAQTPIAAELGVAFGLDAVLNTPAELGVAFGVETVNVPNYPAELGVAVGLDASPAFAGELGVAFGLDVADVVPVAAELGVAFGLDAVLNTPAELGVAFGMDATGQTPTTPELGVAFGMTAVAVAPSTVCTPALWPLVLTIDVIDTGSCAGATGIYTFNWAPTNIVTGGPGWIGLSDLDPNVTGVIYCDSGTGLFMMSIYDASNGHLEGYPLNFAGFFPDIAASVPHDFGPGYSFCSGTFNVFGINGRLV